LNSKTNFKNKKITFLMIQWAVGTELVAWGGTNASGTWVGRRLGQGGTLGDGRRAASAPGSRAWGGDRWQRPLWWVAWRAAGGVPGNVSNEVMCSTWGETEGNKSTCMNFFKSSVI
jgi:hypothetical protein